MLVKKRKKQDSGDESEDPPAKKANLFSGSVFRRNIQGEDAFTAVKEFVHLCKSTDIQNVVLQYLEAGGGALELLGLLQSDEKKNMAFVTSVFSAIQYIVMNTLTDAHQFRFSTEEACKHLLNHHLASVHEMLSTQSTAKYRQIVLKLLAAMATLSPQLARMILTHVKIGPYLWPSFVKHTQPIDKSVRTSFIHFLMSFFFDGSVPVIRTLLEMKGLLTSIVPGLLYDSSHTVHLVLTTLKDKVLMNVAISKTTKLHTFNTHVVRFLIGLYDWKGPSNWKPTMKNRNDGVKDTVEDEDVERKEYKQIVVDAVHEFLQVLCASHKYGVIFHDRSIGTSNKKHNELLQTVLDNLESPWEHERKTELVVKILTACPEMMKCVMANVDPFLEPRVSINWFKAIDFVKQLVQCMSPDQTLKPYSDNLSMNQLTSVVQTLTMPFVLLRTVNSGMLQRNKLVIRHESLNLLLIMLKQFSCFITSVEQWNLIDNTTEHAFKQNIRKQLPNMDVIFSLWQKALLPTEENENEEEEDILSDVAYNTKLSLHLVAIMDLLFLYNECFPYTLDIPSSINFLADIEHISINKENQEDMAILQEKVLQLMITVDSFAFTPEKEMFTDAINRLSYLVDYPSDIIPIQARNILCTLLINTGLFEGVVGEVSVWLHCYLAVSTNHRKSVVNLLVDAIVRVSQNPTKYTNLIAQSEEVSKNDTVHTLDKSQVDDVFDELLETANDEVNEENVQDTGNYLPVATIAMSPLLPGILEVAAEMCVVDQVEGVKYFVSCVVIHLLHSQSSPQTLLHLIKFWPGSLPSTVLTYVNGWTSNGSPQPLKKPFGSQSPESKLSKALLRHDGSSVHHILGLHADLSSMNNENNTLIPLKTSSLLPGKEILFMRDPVHVLLLYKLSMFHMTQLASRGELTLKLQDKCKDALLSLLSIVSLLDGTHADETAIASSKEMFRLLDQEHLMLYCLKHTFAHPFLIQTFTPLQRKKQLVEKMMTEVILELVKFSSLSKGDVTMVSEFLKPFKQKLIHHIIRRLKKCEENKISTLNMESVVPMVELFELSFADIVKLMDHIVMVPAEALISTGDDLSSLSVWGNLLGHLLSRCVALHKPMKSAVITSIAKSLARMTKQEKLDFVPLQEHFLQYLEQFPHHLEHTPKRLLFSLLHQKVVNNSSIKLSVFLLSHKRVLIHNFVSNTKANRNLKDNVPVLCSLLSLALKLNISVDHFILNKIYDQCNVEIETAVLKPSEAAEWLRYNNSVGVQLIDKCMDIGVCQRLCDEIKSMATKFDKYEDFHINLVKSMFAKMAKSQSVDKTSQISFVILLLEMLNNLPKEDEIDQKQMTILCLALQDVITLIAQNQVNCAPLIDNSIWFAFCKMCLKFGLQAHKDMNGMLLQTLTNLCDIIYKNNVTEPQVNNLFQMTLSHSEFLNIMLDTAQKKCKLVELLLMLAKKDPSVMSVSHTPIFLSSYNATMNLTDQLVLQMYETGGVNLYEHRPYLWGEAAVSHYSVKSKVGMSLWRQPQTGQVLELLDMDRLLLTIKNFPLNRSLEASQPAKDFCESKIYDPAFLLPLFSHLLAPEAVVKTHKFIRSGGLAFALAAMASSCEDTRAAAYHVVTRLYFHAEAVRSAKGRLLGLQFLDAIRNGVANLNRSVNPQLPCVVSTFLARTSLILSETHHAMYIPLQNFILAKSSLDLNTVPEFFTFFHSCEVEYRLHRLWILQIIRDGLKSSLDFQVCQRCAVFKLLMTFYTSVLADDDTKKLILEVIESTVKIPLPAQWLVSKNGLISWLHQIIRQLSQDDTFLISTTISILFSLWIVLSNSAAQKKMNRIKIKSPLMQNLPHHLLLLMLDLLSKLRSKLALNDLKKYLHALKSVISFDSNKATSGLISIQTMFDIVQLSKETLGSVSDCEDLLMYGCKFAVKTRELSTENDIEQCICYLRSLIIEWLKRMYNSQAPR